MEGWEVRPANDAMQQSTTSTPAYSVPTICESIATTYALEVEGAQIRFGFVSVSTRYVCQSQSCMVLQWKTHLSHVEDDRGLKGGSIVAVVVNRQVSHRLDRFDEGLNHLRLHQSCHVLDRNNMRSSVIAATTKSGKLSVVRKEKVANYGCVSR